jgi:hypothetical protein
MKPSQKKDIERTKYYKLNLENQFVFLSLTTIVAFSVFLIGINFVSYFNSKKYNPDKEKVIQEHKQEPVNSSIIPQTDIHITNNNHKSSSGSSSNPHLPPLTASAETKILEQQRREKIPDAVYIAGSYSLKESQNLQNIVDRVVTIIDEQKLPLEDLSITLIDVNTNEIAGYQQSKLRYPASVVKLFWLVALYGQYYFGIWKDPNLFSNDIIAMMKDSDNESASRIVDSITQTNSGDILNGKEYENWFYKRTWLNRYFENTSYKGINISQKTYPIPYLNYSLPEGRDKQMRGNEQQPIRNQISTYQAARLMYEIATNRAFNPDYSQALKQVLFWNLTTEPRRNNDPNQGFFNPINTFFGENLPTEIEFYSKAGWTSGSRNEVAFIKTKDGKKAYILAIFGENSLYAENYRLFPQISTLVYQKMTE